MWVVVYLLQNCCQTWSMRSPVVQSARQGLPSELGLNGLIDTAKFTILTRRQARPSGKSTQALVFCVSIIKRYLLASPLFKG